MLLTTHDLYDLHTVFVHIRHAPDHPIYPMLRAAFEAIFSRLKAGDFENAGTVADAFHNIPLILAVPETRGCRRRIAGELTRARKLYGREFLREELERLPR